MKFLIMMMFTVLTGLEIPLKVLPQSQSNEIVLQTDETFLSLPVTPSQAEYDEYWAKIRYFLLQHWESSQSGRLRTEHFTKEGDRVANFYEIVASANTPRRLRVRIERSFKGRNPRESTYLKPQTTVQEYFVAQIERLDSKDRLRGKGVVTVGQPTGKSFTLLLKDDNGRLITKI